MMKILENLDFKYRIFGAIMGVNLLFMIAMASFDIYKDTIWQDSEKKIHLERIQNRIEQVFEKEMREGDGSRQERVEIFKNKIKNNIIVDNVEVVCYDKNGIGEKKDIEDDIITVLLKDGGEVFITKDEGNIKYYHLYKVLYEKNKPLAIIDIYEKTDTIFLSEKLQIIIKQYLLAILIMLIVSAYIALGISKILIKKLTILTKQLPKTNIEYLDTPILEYRGEDEISPLISSYNTMLIKLKDQAEKLAQTEREESWRLMAEQIVHDIRNPLTPMKLLVQNFQRKYNITDENNVEKINKLVETIVHQIDAIYDITQSLSDFSNAPLENENIDIVKVLRYILDIFPEEIIDFKTNVETLYYDKINETHFSRVITNIVKNAIQAISHQNKRVEVELMNEGYKFLISVKDNGDGITMENRDKIFDRKFTTKSSGMGVGLFIVKKIVENSNGRIWFNTEEGKGTIFYVEFYK